MARRIRQAPARVLEGLENGAALQVGQRALARGFQKHGLTQYVLAHA
jgi:hypothetical protein